MDATMNLPIKTFLLTVAVLIIVGCTTQPIQNRDNENIPTLNNGEAASLEDVEGAIVAAARIKGWNPRIISPGLIEARIIVRSHRAAAAITYTENSYSIHYKESYNLDYSDGNIHRNYNKWISNLSAEIQKQLGMRTQNH
jgi:hypothetical protein